MVHVCVCSFLPSVSHPILLCFQVQEYYRFLPLMAYLAVNYMDRASLHLKNWMRLQSVLQDATREPQTR